MKKFIKVLAKIARVICFVVLIAGVIAVVASFGFTVYLIFLNTHHGFVEMSNSASSFTLSIIDISIAIFMAGAIGFLKSSDSVKKPAI